MFHVYVIENMKGTLYVGQTEDIDRRLAEHELDFHLAISPHWW